MSYEEVYKNAYSHGLENIYALEIVDISSVRPILQNTISLNEEIKNNNIAEQLEFDFGPPFREWMESFVLGEPVHVLGLSNQAEKGLQRHEKFILKDLIEADFQDFVFLKGLGQGHLDEIQKKLRNHIENREIIKSKTIDFTAWLRGISASLDKKKMTLFAETFGIEELFPLSGAESVEIRNLSKENQNLWTSEMMQELKTEKRRSHVHDTMQQVVEVYILPWMTRRGGLANFDEIIDRLILISDTKDTENVLALFSHLYFEDNFPLAKFLYQIDKGLFAVSNKAAINFQSIIEMAFSYFYKPELSYNLELLCHWIEREMIRKWENYNSILIESILTKTTYFHVQKNANGKLHISLA